MTALTPGAHVSWHGLHGTVITINTEPTCVVRFRSGEQVTCPVGALREVVET